MVIRVVQVIIYQLPLRDTRKFCGTFTGRADPFDLTAYNKVYICDRPDNYDEDEAFEEFNIRHPKDFTGHSLSVGDVVSVNGKTFFCDSYGWCEIIDGKRQGNKYMESLKTK